MDFNKFYQGDVLKVLKTFPAESVDCVVTSPPYWGLRDYGTAKWEGGISGCDHKAGRATRGGLSEFQSSNKGSFGDEAIRQGECCSHCGAKRVDNQIGLEKTPEEYVVRMVEVFKEVKRILKKEGTLWLNLGDSYAGRGRGLDADGTWNPGQGSMQETHRYNKSQMAKRKVSRKSLSKNLIDNRAIGNAWVKPPLGLKPKDLVGIPWRVAFSLQADGWYLRQDIVWHKPNSMPESVKDRCGKAHEYIFLLAKNQKYYFDYRAIQEPAAYDGRKQERIRGSTKYTDKELVPWNSPHTFAARGHVRWSKNEEGERVRNKRSVWTVNNRPFKEAHFATYPEDLIKPMIKAGCPQGGVVLDPFMGSGTTALVARNLSRKFIGIELNPKYIEIAEKRLLDRFGMFK